MYVSKTLNKLKESLCGDDIASNEYYQAVSEVFNNIKPLLTKYPEYMHKKILERLIVPEQVHKFKITWENDKGEIEVNTGFRVQYNSSLGIYKGGLRFHPSVNEKILKFLAFEQTFKNSLTGLPMGGAKGGSDFDPKGKSDSEIMRFCYAFAEKINPYIGEYTDVPAGDIGVGNRELGYMYTVLSNLRNRAEFGIITGKPISMNGSLLRPEATGYGVIYFLIEMINQKERLNIMKTKNYINELKERKPLQDKKIAISGSGNVATFAAEKAIQLGAKVIGMSDSKGVLIDSSGINIEKVKEIKSKKKSLESYLHVANGEFIPHDKSKNYSPLWNIKDLDIALPCATQNELNEKDAQNLIKNGCKYIVEGANMPSTQKAVDLILKSDIYFGPAKAANAGGVSVSFLEMSQNASLEQWTAYEVEMKLVSIMDKIYSNCFITAKDFGDKNNLLMGANIFGFQRVADSMISGGLKR